MSDAKSYTEHTICTMCGEPLRDVACCHICEQLGCDYQKEYRLKIVELEAQLSLAISDLEDMRKAKDSTYDELQKALKRMHEAEADNASLFALHVEHNEVLARYFHIYGADHEEVCPGDDTCGCIGTSEIGPIGKRIQREVFDTEHPGAAILAERDALAKRVEALITQHDTMVETQQRNLAAMDKLVSEKDYQLTQLCAERDALKAEITELDTISYIRADRLADLRDAHQTALARIAELEASTKWQDIATAPKDGKPFLQLWYVGAFGNESPYKICSGYYAFPDSIIGTGAFRGDGDEVTPKNQDAFVGWQSLPQPPAGSEAGA